MEDHEGNRRRVVLHPRTAMARRSDRARSFGGHVRGYTVVTDDVMQLVNRQRRVALALLACILVPLLAFGLLVGRIEALSTWQPFGLLPLPWLILGPGGLFSVVLIAYVHERLALRIENDWSDAHAEKQAVEPSSGATGHADGDTNTDTNTGDKGDGISDADIDPASQGGEPEREVSE